MALYLQASGAIFSLTAVIWQHSAVVSYGIAMKIMTLNSVNHQVGTVAMILSWLAVALAFVVALMIFVMILSITLLDEIVDEDEPTSRQTPLPEPRTKDGPGDE